MDPNPSASAAPTGLHVVVLGGGASGSTAALALARAGHRVTVLEREARLGGLCGTVERDQFRFDLGGHRLLGSNPSLRRLIEELLGEPLLERQRDSVVWSGDRQYRYPFELGDVLAQAPWTRRRRIVGSLLADRKQLREEEASFEDWVVHRFGRVLFRELFAPYTEKLWGVPPSQIAADWAAQRIPPPSLGEVALGMIGVRRATHDDTSDGHGAGGRHYLYPRLGTGQIFDAMARATRAAGGTVRTEVRVNGFALEGNRVRAVRFRDPEGDHELPCDAVISTVALPLLALLLGAGNPPAPVLRSAGKLRYRAMRLHHVLLDRPEVMRHTWTYVANPRLPMTRIEEPRRRSEALAPPGRTSLVLELPCELGGALWTSTDEEIHERCCGALAELGLPEVREATIGYFSSFVEEGYPVYHLGYRDDRAAVLAYVGGVENVTTCGRLGEFRYVLIDTDMEMGLSAAEALARGRSA